MVVFPKFCRMAHCHEIQAALIKMEPRKYAKLTIGQQTFNDIECERFDRS
jgi:hypothetical protein